MEDASLSEHPWLHCNECSRGFDHHNVLEPYGRGQFRVAKSDLAFYITACGHVFCENCISTQQSSKFCCLPCNAPTSLYKLDGVLPKKLESFLKPPTGLMEEAVSVMMFQLNNGNELIRGLRAKVAQQKDLLTKAKTELAQQRKLREQVSSLQGENESLRRQLERAGPSTASGSQYMKSPAISIRMPGRLSLKSPRMQGIPEASVLNSRVFNTPIKSPMTPYNSYQSNAWQPPPSSSVRPRRYPSERPHF